MPFLTKGEFAEKCGIETKKLSVYISRKKVILTTEGLIDPDNALNVQFFKHQETLGGAKRLQKYVVDVEKTAPTEVNDVGDKPKKARKSFKKDSDPDKFDIRFDLDTTKKQAEIKKIELETRIQEQKQAKMLGQLVPTDLVKSLFAQHFKDVTISFKQAADIFLTEIAKKAKLGRNEQAEMKGQLIRIINNAVEESVIQSKKSVVKMVQDHSLKNK